MSDSGKSSDSQGRSRRLRLVEEPLWLAGANRTAKGRLVANVHNARLFLESCPYLPGEFRVAWDEMLQGVVCGLEREPLGDSSVSRMIDWFETQGFQNFPENYLRHAIAIVAEETRFYPLTEWLNSLQWDHKPRLASWLHDYLETPHDPYHSVIGTMFIRSMIARAKYPGCKADYMLVLEGPQRRLKSTVCEILAKFPEYFSDSLPDLSGDGVRVAMHLRGKWLIEVSEMHAFSRAEASRLKQFLSSKVERYTPKYGRDEVREPRRNVLIGTTNKATYLRDETGGSRFWPVRCGNIKIDALRRDIDQLLAEAWFDVSVLEKPWWPPPEFEEQIIGPVQDSRYDGDAWEQPIAEWDFMIPKCDPNGRPITGDNANRNLVYPPYYFKDIALGALGILPGQFRKAEELRLAKTLEFMGWTRAKRTTRGIPWNPPTGDVAM